MGGSTRTSPGDGTDSDTATLSPPDLSSGDESLPVARCLEIHRIMVRTRIMEERMIKMSKSGEGYFWIGGPGEEAFNACLGLASQEGLRPRLRLPPPPLPQQRHSARAWACRCSTASARWR